MDNKLLEICIKEILETEHAAGTDLSDAARALTDFYQLIEEDDNAFLGYKLYSKISTHYYDKLKELGLLDEEDGEI